MRQPQQIDDYEKNLRLSKIISKNMVPGPFYFYVQMIENVQGIDDFQTISNCFHKLLDNILRNQFAPYSHIRQNQKTDRPKKTLNTYFKRFIYVKFQQRQTKDTHPCRKVLRWPSTPALFSGAVFFSPYRTSLLRVTTAPQTQCGQTSHGLAPVEHQWI